MLYVLLALLVLELTATGSHWSTKGKPQYHSVPVPVTYTTSLYVLYQRNIHIQSYSIDQSQEPVVEPYLVLVEHHPGVVAQAQKTRFQVKSKLKASFSFIRLKY